MRAARDYCFPNFPTYYYLKREEIAQEANHRLCSAWDMSQYVTIRHNVTIMYNHRNGTADVQSCQISGSNFWFSQGLVKNNQGTYLLNLFFQSQISIYVYIFSIIMACMWMEEHNE